VRLYDRLHMIASLQTFLDSPFYEKNSTFCGKTKDDFIECDEAELTFLYEKMNEVMKYINTRSVFDMKGFGK
jgi:hypothetical protein